MVYIVTCTKTCASLKEAFVELTTDFISSITVGIVFISWPSIASFLNDRERGS